MNAKFLIVDLAHWSASAIVVPPLVHKQNLVSCSVAMAAVAEPTLSASDNSGGRSGSGSAAEWEMSESSTSARFADLASQMERLCHSQQADRARVEELELQNQTCRANVQQLQEQVEALATDVQRFLNRVPPPTPPPPGMAAAAVPNAAAVPKAAAAVGVVAEVPNAGPVRDPHENAPQMDFSDWHHSRAKLA